MAFCFLYQRGCDVFSNRWTNSRSASAACSAQYGERIFLGREQFSWPHNIKIGSALARSRQCFFLARVAMRSISFTTTSRVFVSNRRPRWQRDLRNDRRCPKARVMRSDAPPRCVNCGHKISNHKPTSKHQRVGPVTKRCTVPLSTRGPSCRCENPSKA
jgi:hypothetical protein